VIAAENVTIRAGGRGLLRDAAATVAPGEFVAIIGPNGAGKSTLLRVLAGELRAEQGGVTVDGVPVARIPRIELARRRAVLPQAVRLAFAMRVADVVALGRTPHFGSAAMRDDRVATESAMVWAGIGEMRARLFDTLSGGEQQRVSLARVFAQIWTREQAASRYLLLDEPTAPLDIAQQHHVLRLVRKLADDGIGVCAVLHDLNQAAMWADRIVAVRDGACIADGPPDEVIAADTLEAIYGVPFEVLAAQEGPRSARIRFSTR
jgi:iron complex transport system ATP-binding protein